MVSSLTVLASKDNDLRISAEIDGVVTIPSSSNPEPSRGIVIEADLLNSGMTSAITTPQWVQGSNCTQME